MQETTERAFQFSKQVFSKESIFPSKFHEMEMANVSDLSLEREITITLNSEQNTKDIHSVNFWLTNVYDRTCNILRIFL